MKVKNIHINIVKDSITCSKNDRIENNLKMFITENIKKDTTNNRAILLKNLVNKKVSSIKAFMA